MHRITGKTGRNDLGPDDFGWRRLREAFLLEPTGGVLREQQGADTPLRIVQRGPHGVPSVEDHPILRGLAGRLSCRPPIVTIGGCGRAARMARRGGRPPWAFPEASRHRGVLSRAGRLGNVGVTWVASAFCETDGRWCFFRLTLGRRLPITRPTGIPARRRGVSVCRIPQHARRWAVPEGCPSG